MRKILTEKDFIFELKKVNPNILLLSSYKGLTIQKVKCKCLKCQNEWETFPYILLNGHGCKVCNKRAFGEFFYNIHDVITSNNRNLLILDREYRSREIKRENKQPYYQNRKYYQYKCLDCGNIDWAIECRLKSGDGCNVCSHNLNRLVKGVNDIATLFPKTALLFKDKSLPYNCTKGSKNVAVFICPDCGREIRKRIDAVCFSGLNCPCGDNWSYPNKFLYALLEQFHVKFFPEKSFIWSEGKRYDEYVEYNGKRIIIEMHGEQHYGKPINNQRSVKEEQNNDRYKIELAIKNSITDYFTIDCRKSQLDYIRESIISSGLLEIFRISKDNIDWNQCDIFATTNFTKTICDFYNDHPELSSHDLAEHFHLNIKVTQRYLRKGNKYGWCNYDGYRDRKSFSHNNRKKPVYCIDINKSFESALDAAKYLNLPDANNNGKAIRNAIKKNITYHGFSFSFCDTIEESPMEENNTTSK